VGIADVLFLYWFPLRRVYIQNLKLYTLRSLTISSLFVVFDLVNTHSYTHLNFHIYIYLYIFASYYYS